MLIGQGGHPGPRDLYDRHPVFHRELLEAHVEDGAGVTSADHRGHAVQRWLERQVERPVSTVHEHVRSRLDLGQGAGLRGEVVRAGAAARHHRTAEPGGAQPGQLVLDVQRGLLDQGGADLAAVPVYGVPLVRLQAAEVERVVSGDPLGQRDQAGVAER
ncbi:MAG TPA: hypothetical protein VN870_01620 [Streptosporangiaceae bacterium]|nr:hypothetical protein [Streptosporangiaceae bacterium]